MPRNSKNTTPSSPFPLPPQYQGVPIRPQNQNPLFTSPHDPTRPFFLPYGPPGHAGSFLPVGFPPPQLPIPYSQGVRAMPSPHLENFNHAVHVTRSPQFPYPFPLPLPPPPPPPVTGKVAASRSTAPVKASPSCTVSKRNGRKNASGRKKSTSDTVAVVRGRNVKMTEDASLYALARSWLRNGEEEEIQPQQKPLMSLPKPLPASPAASDMLNEKEDEKVEKDEVEKEESEKCVDELTPEQLLKQHVEHAKRVKARLKERLQRIKRYRNRIKLFLPLDDD